MLVGRVQTSALYANYGVRECNPDPIGMKFKTKLFLITLLPVILISAATLLVTNFQSSRLAQSQAQTVENLFLELKNYAMLARNALTPIYGSNLKAKRGTQREITEIVRKITFGEDRYFFIYEEDGTNIVNPRLTYLIGSNWIGLEDDDGRQVVKDLIDRAQVRVESSIPISGRSRRVANMSKNSAIPSISTNGTGCSESASI